VSRNVTPTEPPSPSPTRGASSAELDGSTFERLFRECARDVHGYVIALLGDRAGAEDVTALAFERLYGARKRLDHARGTPRAWLFSIARNAALDELRRRRRHGAGGLEPERVESPDGGHQLAAGQTRQADPAEAIEQAERRATLHAAVLELPPREREVVLLKFHGQLTNVELARVLGISESNAGTRVHRALTRLRETCAELARREVA
jgi:RNA polymerase sigma factor (sigma-70 family)